MSNATIDKIWKKVTFHPGGCWLWQGTKTPAGYGCMRAGPPINGAAKQLYTHRLVYQMLVGEIPDGLHIDHLCRVRHCVNPNHLEAVTQRENVLRGQGKGAINSRKDRCHKGHLLDGVRNGGGRYCRTCTRDGNRARMAKYRAMGRVNKV